MVSFVDNIWTVNNLYDKQLRSLIDKNSNLYLAD